MNENMTLSESIAAHCNESMERALLAERHTLWKRLCPEMSDMDFIRFGLLRCISTVDSGRHFLQTTEEVHGEHIPHSTYFKSLKSPRRTNMLEALEKQSYEIHCEDLASEEIDYLKDFPELDEYTVEAADGHFIDHACHTTKGDNDKVYAAGFIYAMNLRNGLLRPFCCITNGTKRNHEIPVLRNYIEENNSNENKLQKNLYVYDKAATDYPWWDKQKSQNNFMITVLKENSAAKFVEEIPFDKSIVINTGIEAYSTYESNGVKFSVVRYCDPETQKVYNFVTTLPKSMSPGIIAILYYKRWTIEKAFNNNKSDFKEQKAWSSDFRSLRNQMRLTTMAYNLIRVFEEKSKIGGPELVHPSDKKYTAALDKRQEIAKKKGFFINPLLFCARVVRISSFTIRAVQNAIITGKSLASLMSALVGRLVPG